MLIIAGNVVPESHILHSGDGRKSVGKVLTIAGNVLSEL